MKNKIKNSIAIIIFLALMYLVYTKIFSVDEAPATQDTLAVDSVQVDSIILIDTTKVDTSK